MKVVDMHCDTVLELYRNRQENKLGDLLHNEFHVDLEKMQKGDYLLQNFAMFVNLKRDTKPLQHCLNLLDTIYEEIKRYATKIRIVRSYEEILKNWDEGILSGLLTIEEGGVIQGSLANLRNFYRLGVRMMTLTWNYPNEIGYPNCLTKDGDKVTYGEGNGVNGLTPFGLEVIAEMEKLGMMIDVSHLSDAGFYDVLSNTTKPFVASHSNARTLCPHVRNMTDDMIRKLSERGGVLGLNYEGEFLKYEHPFAYSKVDAFVAHVKHIVNVGGYECLGLGSDFDGINTPEDIRDASCLPRFAQELEKAGLTNNQIEAIFHKNVLRVYREILV